MSFRIIAAPAAPTSPDHADAWAYEGYSRLRHDSELATWGNTDRWAPTFVLIGVMADTPWHRTRLLVAVPEAAAEAPSAAAVIGAAEISWRLTDNPHLGQLHLEVAAEHRGRGIGSALLAAAEQLLANEGRTVVIGGGAHSPEPDPGPGSLTAPTGSGRVPAQAAATSFLTRHGYGLEQVTRASVLQVPESEAIDQALATAQAAAGPDFVIHRFDREVPDHWLPGLARLWARMSTDVPLGELELAAEPWDAERVAGYLSHAAAAQQQVLLAAVEHLPSGDLVAFTVLQVPNPDVEFGFQDDTLVLPEYRGHRLGMLVKAANLRQLADLRPAVRRIHTSNAEENRWMLAINVELGFEPAGVYALWQKKLAGDPVGSGDETGVPSQHA